MNINVIKYLVIGVVGLILLTIINPFTTVGTGERGVVTHFGKVTGEVLDEGFHVITPVMTSVKTISVRVQKSELNGQASSKDMQLVTSKVAINWSISRTAVGKVFQEVGDEEAVVERILDPAVSEIFKAVTAKRTAEEIITKREEVSAETKQMLHERLVNYGLELKEVSILNFKFTEEFDNAIEAKQVAEQKAKQADYDALRATAEAKGAVNKARGEAEAMLTNAKAQAEAQKLLRQTISSELLQLKAIEKWDGVMPQIMGSSNGGLMFNVPTPKAK